MTRYSRRQQAFTLLELAAVTIVIAILVSIGVRYYTQAVIDGKRTSVELLANRFTAAIALLHAQWIIEGMPKTLDLDGYVIVMSKTGWPTNAAGIVHTKQDITPRQKPCYNIWHAILQNPARLNLSNHTPGVGYYLSISPEGNCHYQLITKGSEKFYFEYFLSNGRVEIHAT